MEARELRIGNLVETSEDSSYPYGEITCISNAFIIVESDSFDKEDFKYIRPIPLTEEWLIKFGFFRTDFGMRFPGKASIYLNIGQDGFSTFFSINHHSEHLVAEPIKYVHQLQNLYFALTGEELTIK